MDALEDLKAANEIISSSFQNDLLILQDRFKAVSTDFEQQRTQLVDALVSKDRIMQDLVALKEQTGTNGEDLAKKAHEKATIAESSRHALEEVSLQSSSKTRRTTPKKFFSRLGLTIFPSNQPKRQSAVSKSSFNPNTEAIHDAELDRELAALGVTPQSLSPRWLPIPPSPSHPNLLQRRHNLYFHRST